MTVFSGRRGSPASTSRSWPLLQPAAPACGKEGWGKTGFLASGHHPEFASFSGSHTASPNCTRGRKRAWMTFLSLQERKDMLGSQPRCASVAPWLYRDLCPKESRGKNEYLALERGRTPGALCHPLFRENFNICIGLWGSRE